MHRLYTVGLVVVQNAHLLLVRKRNTTKFMLPGGKIAPGEQEIACLERELYEELQCQIEKGTLCALGEFTDVAANEADTLVTMKLYKGQLIGNAHPFREIEEIYWLNAKEPREISIAPLVQNHVFPLITHSLPLSGHAFS
jgi:8-oxo-dGTP pyrophosphatase MutT (NUDIX family)